jgi:Domain of unknown function (DUF2760)
MKKNKNISRRAFWWLVLIVFLSVVAMDSVVFFGVHLFSGPMSMLASSSTELPEAAAVTGLFFSVKKDLIHFGGACSFLFFLVIVLLLWLPIRKQLKASALRKPDHSPKASPTDASISAEKKEQDKRLFLYMLTVLQREGRLMDFFSEDLTPFEDAQIGAAVRSIHENCKKVVLKSLAPKPVIDEEEGATITVPSGFDPSAIKLVGNVSGNPPFSGILRHRGWQAKKTELPTLSSTQNASIISPAEVEIS